MPSEEEISNAGAIIIAAVDRLDHVRDQGRLHEGPLKVPIGYADTITGTNNVPIVVNHRAIGKNYKKRSRETKGNTIRRDGELY